MSYAAPEKENSAVERAVESYAEQSQVDGVLVDEATERRLDSCMSVLNKNLKHTWGAVRKNAPCWGFFFPTDSEIPRDSKQQSVTCLICKTYQADGIPEGLFPEEGEHALSTSGEFPERDVQTWLPDRGKEGKFVIDYNSRHSTGKLTWHLNACHKDAWERFSSLTGNAFGGVGNKRKLPTSVFAKPDESAAGENKEGGNEVAATKFKGNVTLESLRAKVAHFAAERDWDQFHTPRNLILALVGEVGELSEIFQWRGEQPRGLPDWSKADKEHLGDELSDVLVYLLRISDVCGIDIASAALDKLKKNAKKYPVEMCKGSSAKYTVYEQHKKLKTGSTSTSTESKDK